MNTEPTADEMMTAAILAPVINICAESPDDIKQMLYIGTVNHDTNQVDYTTIKRESPAQASELTLKHDVVAMAGWADGNLVVFAMAHSGKTRLAAVTDGEEFGFYMSQSPDNDPDSYNPEKHHNLALANMRPWSDYKRKEAAMKGEQYHE